jgi:hypothetical protein
VGGQAQEDDDIQRKTSLNWEMIAFEITFLALQTIVVVFLLFHDWVPLGRLNNLTAIRSQDSVARSVFVTLLPAVPAAAGLFFSAKYFGEPYPHWLEMLLWITYGLFVVGLLRAWWIPYLFKSDPERAARYQIIFANTHSFLPKRNGMAPDTLHTCFHLVAVATVIALFLRDRFMSL